MTSSDKDFRFMATNDLMAELQKDSIKLDDDSERKVGFQKRRGGEGRGGEDWTCEYSQLSLSGHSLNRAPL